MESKKLEQMKADFRGVIKKGPFYQGGAHAKTLGDALWDIDREGVLWMLWKKDIWIFAAPATALKIRSTEAILPVNGIAVYGVRSLSGLQAR